MAEIMDVSRYQGTIDWAKVKASGKVDGVMIPVQRLKQVKRTRVKEGRKRLV